MRNSLFLKFLAIVAITIALVIALARIGVIVDERRGRELEAQRSVEQGQAGQQALLGPVLHRSCVEEWEVPVGEGTARKITTERREFRLTAVPEQLRVEGGIALEPRYRGLFKVNSYALKASMQASWPTLAPLRPQREHADSRLSCGAPILMVAVSDARGIRVAEVRAQGQNLKVHSGTFHGSYPLGFHAVLPDAAVDAGDPLTADLNLELLGTGGVSLAPVASTTQVQLSSNWPHPSFGGRFLPSDREVRENGFSATWRVSSLATTAPTDVKRGVALCSGLVNADTAYEAAPRTREGEPAGSRCVETFGVALIDPVNPYVLSDRAIKYGVLFIVLTFVAVGMVEVLKQRRVHPIQYLLVGSALSIFFLLLVSLSEHLAFGIAYSIASAGCGALLAYYASHVLGGWGAGTLFGLAVGALYGALYVLLQMEQTSLVMGSLLLFLVLAAVMIATRKLDWYGLFALSRNA